MAAGSIAGAAGLDVVDSAIFQLTLGTSFIVAGCWFVLKKPKLVQQMVPVERANLRDVGVGAFAGVCGGFVGINAPPLVLYFGSKLPKQLLRRLLVIIFLPAAFAQTGTFFATGLLTTKEVFWGVMLIPAMFVGITLGNKTFTKISPRRFRIFLGLLLLVAASRLLIKAERLSYFSLSVNSATCF